VSSSTDKPPIESRERKFEARVLKSGICNCFMVDSKCSSQKRVDYKVFQGEYDENLDAFENLVQLLK
jgi:hypothetical protein